MWVPRRKDSPACTLGLGGRGGWGRWMCQGGGRPGTVIIGRLSPSVLGEISAATGMRYCSHRSDDCKRPVRRQHLDRGANSNRQGVGGQERCLGLTSTSFGFKYTLVVSYDEEDTSASSAQEVCRGVVASIQPQISDHLYRRETRGTHAEKSNCVKCS